MAYQFEQFEQLLSSPRLPFYVRQMQALLVDEAEKRLVFYEQITEDDKVEFINGEIFFHSPVKLRHNKASVNLLVLMQAYVTKHDLGFVGHEKIMISLTRNDYEPDICYFGKHKSAQFKSDQMRFPAPDFVVEVLSASTAANDRGVKFDDYAAHGISEYWIVDPDAETVEQYQLQDEVYELVVKIKTGQLDSWTIPDFGISVRAIFDGQENKLALQQLLSA